MSDDPRPSDARQNFLSLFLATVLGGFFLFVLVLLTGGLFLYVVLLVAFIGFLALFHYVLWGKLMSDSVAGEREEEQLRQRALSEEGGRAHRGKFQR